VAHPHGPASDEVTPGDGTMAPAAPVHIEPHRPVPQAGRICRCGHGKTAHEHYRGGADCALCSCPKFRYRLLSRLPLIGG
jgi:hypothetical protein